MLPLVYVPTASLFKPSARVADPVRYRDFCSDLAETMYAVPAVGLSAPQVGHHVRIFCMDLAPHQDPADLWCIVNPEVMERSAAKFQMEEGCASFPGKTVKIMRSEWIRIKWQTPWGHEKTEVFHGYHAAIVEHELDHLDGKLILG